MPTEAVFCSPFISMFIGKVLVERYLTGKELMIRYLCIYNRLSCACQPRIEGVENYEELPVSFYTMGRDDGPGGAGDPLQITVCSDCDIVGH
jgi:hypothetical protein